MGRLHMDICLSTSRLRTSYVDVQPPWNNLLGICHNSERPKCLFIISPSSSWFSKSILRQLCWLSHADLLKKSIIQACLWFFLLEEIALVAGVRVSPSLFTRTLALYGISDPELRWLPRLASECSERVCRKVVFWFWSWFEESYHHGV